MRNTQNLNDLIYTKDPRGLVRQDVEHLKKKFKNRPITPQRTQNEIMYDAGIQAVITYIEDNMVK